MTFKANWYISQSTISVSASSFFFFSFYIFNWHLPAKSDWRLLRNFPVKRSIKSRQLQVTPNQRKQLMHHMPGSAYVSSREQTPVCPQSPQKRCMTWNQAPLTITCWCPESLPVTDSPLSLPTVWASLWGMSAGYQELLQAAQTCSLQSRVASWVLSFAKKQLFPLPCLSLAQQVELSSSI